MSPEEVNDLIHSRRSVFPPVFTEQPIPREVIQQLVENANWAPNHRHTEPWRFHIFRGEARTRLADFLAEAYTLSTSETTFSETKREKTRKNVLRSDTILVIILQRDPEEKVPEWEEIAAVAAAVQNLWLTATAYGLGGYWSTPGTLPALTDWLGLPTGQRCIGLFYLGNHALPPTLGERGSIDDKVTWIEE